MWKQIWQHVDKTLLGSITVLAFFILQFSWFLTEPSDLVPIWIVHALAIVFYLCCILIYAFCRSKPATVQYRLPRVLTVSGMGSDAILILEKSELFSYHMVVTIYHQNGPGKLEIPIAIGMVETINQQGYPQIRMTKILEPEIIKDVFPAGQVSASSRKWKTVYVKPAILQEYLAGIFGEEV